MCKRHPHTLRSRPAFPCAAVGNGVDVIAVVGNSVQHLLGVSAVVKEIDAEIGYASRSDAKVLITGESGVGKEVVARLIHERSRRFHIPLVTINCAGVPDSLLESEL